jgi:hypothetical protein
VATPFSGSCCIDLCGHIDAIQALNQITRTAPQRGHFNCRCNDDTGFLRSFSFAHCNAPGGSHFLRNKCSDFLDRARPAAFRLFEPFNQFRNYSLTVRLPASGEEVGKQVIGLVRHYFRSLRSEPLGRDAMPDVATLSIGLLSPFHVLQKLHDKWMLFARPHQTFYDRGKNAIMQVSGKVQALILPEFGFLREDRSQQMEHAARKAQSVFIDGLHLVFATVTFALLSQAQIKHLRREFGRVAFDSARRVLSAPSPEAHLNRAINANSAPRCTRGCASPAIGLPALREPSSVAGPAFRLTAILILLAAGHSPVSEAGP